MVVQKQRIKNVTQRTCDDGLIFGLGKHCSKQSPQYLSCRKGITRETYRRDSETANR
jgi:hypothetical protein